MNKEKLLSCYQYANQISYRFEKLRYLRQDLVHEVMLHLIENPSKLEAITYIKSYIHQAMKWKHADIFRVNHYKRIDYTIDEPVAGLKNTNWLDINPQSEINSPEKHCDINIIKEYVDKGKLNKRGNKGNTREIFYLTLEGYSPEEISKKLNITQHSVNQSVCNTRIKLNNYFRK